MLLFASIPIHDYKDLYGIVSDELLERYTEKRREVTRLYLEMFNEVGRTNRLKAWFELSEIADEIKKKINELKIS